MKTIMFAGAIVSRLWSPALCLAICVTMLGCDAEVEGPATDAKQPATETISACIAAAASTDVGGPAAGEDAAEEVVAYDPCEWCLRQLNSCLAAAKRRWLKCLATNPCGQFVCDLTFDDDMEACDNQYDICFQNNC